MRKGRSLIQEVRSPFSDQKKGDRLSKKGDLPFSGKGDLLFVTKNEDLPFCKKIFLIGEREIPLFE
jgi:hypothetical protein